MKMQFSVIILLFFTACNTPEEHVDSLDQKKQADTNNGSYSTYVDRPRSGQVEDSIVKGLIGKIVPNLMDTTLIKLVYGSFYFKNDEAVYNKGPQIWDNSDSTYMKLETSFGNDTVQIIYLRGTMAITTNMHNHYNETGLIFNKKNDQWELVDAYFDTEVIDAADLTVIDSYFGGFLVKSETNGIYAGGVEYSGVNYSIIAFNSFSGPSLSFLTASSNQASDQCIPKDDELNYHCDCYANEGVVKFSYNRKWNCLVFKYHFKSTQGDCNMHESSADSTDQTWYMNADTSFLARGKRITKWGEEILEEVNLTESDVKMYLGIVK